MKDKKIATTVPPVKLSQIKKMISSLEKVIQGDPDISFEYLLASLFPTCWKNIQKDLNNQYTLGYLQGKEETKNLKK